MSNKDKPIVTCWNKIGNIYKCSVFAILNTIQSILTFNADAVPALKEFLKLEARKRPQTVALRFGQIKLFLI
jgi:hypothetical protein